VILVTGDTHGLIDVNKIFGLRDRKILSEDDYLIVLGDFGVCWDGGSGDMRTRRFWNRVPWHTLFLDGNHENHSVLNKYRESERFGGKVHEISDKITHLMRGGVYTIEGKSIFTFGGAVSHDCGQNLEAFLDANCKQYYELDWEQV